MPMSTEETYQYNVFKRDYERWKYNIDEWKKHIDERNKIRDGWIDVLACEAFKCHTEGPDKGQPIYKANGNLPEKSKFDVLEDRFNGVVSLLGINEGSQNEGSQNDEGAQPRGGRRTRGKKRSKSRKKRRKKKTKKRRKKRRRKKRTKRRK